MNVLMAGVWHLGSVIGACLAEAGHQVHLWDQNSPVAEKWKNGQTPIHEPGLNEMVAKHWRTNLHWTENLKEVSKKADWICITYDTPINEKDEVQLQVVEDGFDTIIKSGISENCHFFLTSQLPVGTSRRFRARILTAFPAWKGHLFYQPENLRLGEAIKSFQNPDRMVLGLDQLERRENLVSQFQQLTGNSTTPLNFMGLESAEMVKHAMNSFLATCVVFANEISDVCEKQGADAWDVMNSLKQDSRVGPKAFLRPGLGFSGGTLARDVKTLSHLSQREPAQNLFDQLYRINLLRDDWVVEKLLENLKSLEKKKIVLLGITYKPGTSTVRRSPALEISRLLFRNGAKCVALDPMADLRELNPSERANLSFVLEKDPQTAFRDADAAVLVTEWPQFKELNWNQMKSEMKTPLLIDCKNFFSAETVRDFTHVIPGKGMLS